MNLATSPAPYCAMEIARRNYAPPWHACNIAGTIFSNCRISVHQVLN